MAGDLKAKYGTQVALTFTSFNNLEGSASFVAGAVSLAVDNTSALAQDYLLTAKITWSSTAPANGVYQLDIHAYSNLNDTPDYPLDGAGNALGTDVARTFSQAVDKLNATVQVKSLSLYSTASKVYTMSAVPLAQFIGTPKFWGLFCTHGVTTANSRPHTSGNTFWAMPVLAQYT